MIKTKMSKILAGAVVASSLTTTAAEAVTFNSEANFLNAIQPGFFMDDYEDLAAGDLNISLLARSGSGFSYTVSTDPGYRNLLANSTNAIETRALSTYLSADDLLYDFSSSPKAVRAFGGFFAASDITGNLIDQDITVSFSDGTFSGFTTNTSGPGANFFGIVSDMNILWAKIAAPYHTTYSWPQADNVYLATVPEPSTYALLGSALAFVGYARSRKAKRVIS